MRFVALLIQSGEKSPNTGGFFLYGWVLLRCWARLLRETNKRQVKFRQLENPTSQGLVSIHFSEKLVRFWTEIRVARISTRFRAIPGRIFPFSWAFSKTLPGHGFEVTDGCRQEIFFTTVGQASDSPSWRWESATLADPRPHQLLGIMENYSVAIIRRFP